ncbi:hypothetical protein [Mesorhizobium escarrei]|uniref:Helix-turn-helix domain-containing protein n=1 Tax=Mesorhizobium escarrei TaxID=666018 RepID=A0ABM9E9E3_9HYPH|nr:hypothetical protein [Mesorhizobium escarrei]CAH2405799.1 conserved hypothetical protein [Mesorhizobium escarrei]
MMLIPPDADAPNVLHAFIRKRAEVAGKIEHNQLALRRLIAELDHIDATIRIFEPSIDVGKIPSKPVPPRHAAFKGEVTRIVLSMLREADGPLTSRNIAEELMRQRGLSSDDNDLSVTMVKRVCACLRTHRIKGTIRSVPVAGSLQGWQLSSRDFT